MKNKYPTPIRGLKNKYARAIRGMKNNSFLVDLQKLFLYLLLLNSLLIPSFSQPMREVRVQLFHNKPIPKTVTLSGSFKLLKPLEQNFSGDNFQISCSNGLIHLQNKNRKNIMSAQRLYFQANPKLTLSFKDVRRSYKDQLTVSGGKNCQLKFENTVSAADYVKIVIASETNADWPLEALKTQAVLTQTRLVNYPAGKTIYDSTQDEAYLGLEHLHPKAELACQQTLGQTLIVKNKNTIKPLKAYYHSTCAGQTVSEAYFAGTESSTEQSVKCPYCSQSPFYKTHEGKILKEEFEKVFGSGLPKVAKKDINGSPLLVILNNGQTLTGYQFWLKLGQTFGWDKAPSTNFQIEENKKFVLIKSRGAGHGVGLCQWGAREMALLGKTYLQILQFYFPNAIIKEMNRN